MDGAHSSLLRDWLFFFHSEPCLSGPSSIAFPLLVLINLLFKTSCMFPLRTCTPTTPALLRLLIHFLPKSVIQYPRWCLTTPPRGVRDGKLRLFSQSHSSNGGDSSKKYHCAHHSLTWKAWTYLSPSFTGSQWYCRIRAFLPAATSCTALSRENESMFSMK